MKTRFPHILICFFIALLLQGCHSEDPAPATQNRPVLLAKVRTSNDDSREFTYSPSGWLTTIKGKGFYALNENSESTSRVLYDNWGRIAYVLTDGPHLDTENVYQYTSDHQLYKLEELISGKLESYHTFAYDTNKRLATLISHYKDATAQTPSEKRKTTYVYDAQDNVTEITVYQKASTTAPWQVAQASKYEGYDTKIGVAHLTSFLFTPTLVLHRNNPGKVTTTLANGEQRVTTYSYEYNEKNLPVKRVTTPPAEAAYVTEYTYQY